VGAVNKVERRVKKLLVHRFHALLVERTCVLAVLLTPFAEARVLARRLDSGCRAPKHATGTELEFELSVLGIFGVLGLILSVQVIKIAEELIEAMNGGQEFVAVAKMVLAELPGRVTQRFEQFGERGIL